MPRPPEPTEPAIVQRLRYMRDPLGYLESCRRQYGDIFTLRLVKSGMVIVCSPELTKAVYTAGDDLLVAGEAKIAVFGKVLGQSSTLLLDGPAHLERRRLLLPRFRGELMQTFEPVMIDACTRALDQMPLNTAFPLHPHMHATAFEVILRALFAGTPPAQLQQLREHMHAFATKAVTSRLLMFPALQRDLGPLSPWGKVTRIVASAREAVLGELRRRRRSASTAASNFTDITGLLLDARDDDGAPLGDDEVRDEILTMIAAGHETTSMAMTWLCYAVFTRPAVLAKLRAELAANPAAKLDELPYLDAVVRESLRFYSLIPNGSGRIVKQSFQLGGYDVAAGAMLTVAFHAVHRRADVFERPDEFWPERFLQAKYSPYESVAFGGGTRRCIGMPFALFETKLVLKTLLERCDLELAQDHVKPVWRGMFLTPSRGLHVRRRELVRSAPTRVLSPEARA